jgi:hypothetical protein
MRPQPRRRGAGAFSVFTTDFGRFKPRKHNLLAVEIS